MKRCPYCFETLDHKYPICPHCNQFIVDDLVEINYETADQKKCIFCGKNVLAEAKICRHCHRWLDEVDNAVNDSGE